MRSGLLLALSMTVLACSCQKYQTVEIEDKDYWLSAASVRLDEVLKRKEKNALAKNVIVFIGDGMGMTTITAGRIYHGQKLKRDGESNVLSFEKFPVTGLSKTYNVNTQVPDSASTATAIFSGVKTRQYVLGLDSVASYGTCTAETNEKAKVTTIMNWAQKKGKDTGIVTTTRITHATPAATYSHINNREWECDSKLPPQEVGCVKDIARQLVEDEPGKNFKVILGGGRNQMGDTKDQSRDTSCVRKDNRNLAEEWKKTKTNAMLVRTADELSRVDVKKTDYLMGLFSPTHLDYAIEKRPVRPSLKLMTEKAIGILQRNPKGFVLMVEGGRIDHGHHNNTPELALSELVDFQDAIGAAAELTSSDDTLIIVTADHSHSVTLNGYPARGNDILGLAKNNSRYFYETITYANGPGFESHYSPESDKCDGNCTEEEKKVPHPWKDIRSSAGKDMYYRHLAAVYLPDESHGGEDVPIYARGPKSHLLVGVHEENYIASVISYAACIGPESHRCTSAARSLTTNSLVCALVALVAAFANA